MPGSCRRATKFPNGRRFLFLTLTGLRPRWKKGPRTNRHVAICRRSAVTSKDVAGNCRHLQALEWHRTNKTKMPAALIVEVQWAGRRGQEQRACVPLTSTNILKNYPSRRFEKHLTLCSSRRSIWVPFCPSFTREELNTCVWCGVWQADEVTARIVPILFAIRPPAA
ncbi:uncharacterized protein B0I36DRAFT_97417 [Microdochium trichocladiopsis]|uniref:Uncharacterized protein n=1 Tax=Microdochium trichocladiopsis TaxID=1682393 RepID=A0A9P8YF50_9PEZI|nr:uncharacterized protein B0I36DRAFT_97417 [Microdochium trichocladiopsis]KAH7035862.1 hypothetical protein B0I36DRAFT_97417 [Microdochium trichocladiopsis]